MPHSPQLPIGPAALRQFRFYQSFSVPHTDPEDENVKTVIYTSLRGEPTENGGKYLSDSFVPVGMLTIRVGEISDD